MSPTINFTVLSPTSPLQFSDTNAESIVMKLQVGNTSVMLTGDAQMDTEQSILSSGYNLQSQVLKVGHHGSSTSTSQAFLSAVTPAYAVISAGINNPYGHPTQQTLNILSSNNIITYGTYTYGTVIFSLNSGTPTSTPSPTHAPSASPTPTNNPTPSNLNPTATPSPTSNPTASTIQNPTVKPSDSPNATLSPTPTIPEFPSLIAFIVFAGLISLSIITLRRKTQLQTS